MPPVPTPSRGEIWLINFDPAVGADIQKLRPALVVSVDSIGQHQTRHPAAFVAPARPHATAFDTIKRQSRNGEGAGVVFVRVRASESF